MALFTTFSTETQAQLRLKLAIHYQTMELEDGILIREEVLINDHILRAEKKLISAEATEDETIRKDMRRCEEKYKLSRI